MEEIKKYSLGELLYFAHKELGFSPENMPISEIACIVYKHKSKGYTQKLDHHAIHLAQMFDKYEKDGYGFRYRNGKPEMFKMSLEDRLFGFYSEKSIKIVSELYNPTIIREGNGI